MTVVTNKAQPTTFPESSLRHLLVNKQFFEEAACVWMQNKRFSIRNFGNLQRLLEAMNAAERFLFRHMKSLCVGNSRAFVSAYRLPKLRCLVVKIDSLDFSTREKEAWLDEFTDAELTSPHLLGSLCNFRGVQKLQIAWAEPRSLTELKTKHIEQWQHLKAQVESLVRDIVTLPKERSDDPEANMSFGEALSKMRLASNQREKKKAKEERKAQKAIAPLQASEIPTTQDLFVRLFHARPGALFQWVHRAKRHMLQCKDTKDDAQADASSSDDSSDDTDTTLSSDCELFEGHAPSVFRPMLPPPPMLTRPPPPTLSFVPRLPRPPASIRPSTAQSEALVNFFDVGSESEGD